MSTQPAIHEMTLADLEAFIVQIIRRETQSPDSYQIGNRDPQTLEKILTGTIDQPDAPSPRQMLREDRDK